MTYDETRTVFVLSLCVLACTSNAILSGSRLLQHVWSMAPGQQQHYLGVSWNFRILGVIADTMTYNLTKSLSQVSVTASIYQRMDHFIEKLTVWVAKPPTSMLWQGSSWMYHFMADGTLMTEVFVRGEIPWQVKKPEHREEPTLPFSSGLHLLSINQALPLPHYRPNA